MIILRKTSFITLSLISGLAAGSLATPAAPPSNITAPASPTAAGWKLLWSSRNQTAKAQFRAALQRNPADTGAWRGLGWVALQEDNNLEAMRCWSHIYTLTPRDWTAVAYWPRLGALAEETEQWQALDQAARAVLKAPGVQPELRTAARVALADAAARDGKEADAARQRAALGFVTQWRVIGPFDNVSRAGYDKAYPPEREVAFNQRYAGTNHQVLPWRHLKMIDRNGACDVASSLGDNDDSVYYAATTITAPATQAVALRFSPAGASKIWLNGRLIFEDPVYRRAPTLLPDTFRIAATLRAGGNALLIKLADDGGTSASFSLRCTTPAGNDLPALAKTATTTASYKIAGGQSRAAHDPWWHGYLWPRYQKVPNQEATNTLANVMYALNDNIGAIALMEHETRNGPSARFGWLHLELADALEGEGRRDEARAARDKARQLNPRLVRAELDAIEDAEKSLLTSTVIKRLKSVLAINPRSSRTLWELAGTYLSSDMNTEAIKYMRAALAAEPGQKSTRLQIRWSQALGHEAEAKKQLKAALRIYPRDVALLEQQTEAWRSEAKPREIIAAYRKLQALEPTQSRFHQELAGYYQSTEKWTDAEASLKLAIALRPQDADLQESLGDILREQQRTPAALVAYREAVRLDPSKQDLRERIRILTGAPPDVDLAAATPVGPLLAKPPLARDYPGASTVLLLDENRTVVYPDGSVAAYIHQVIKIMDDGAAQRFQTRRLSGWSGNSDVNIQSARVISPGGKIHDALDEAAGSELNFPALATGDIIDYSYRINDYRSGPLARDFWDSWYFNARNAASLLSRYVLITPSYLQLQTRAHGPVPAPNIRTRGSWKIHEWRMTGLAALAQEILMPGGGDSLTWIDISTVQSWRTIVQWYKGLSDPLCVPDDAVRAKAKLLTQGAKTDDEKIRALATFVARKIQYQTTPFRMSWYIPTEGKQVLREGYGDCKDKAALLTAMLKAVGIEARMVLLSPRDSGLTPYLPSTRFNHAITQVRTAGRTQWIDATSEGSAAGELPVDDQGVPALVIDDAVTDLEISPVAPVEVSQSEETHIAELSADGVLRDSMVSSSTGEIGQAMRAVVKTMSTAQHDSMLRGMATRMVPNTQYESGSFQNVTRPDKPLIMKIAHKAGGYGAFAGKFAITALPWGSVTQGGMQQYIPAAGRRTDLETASMRGVMLGDVTMTLPPGYEPQEMEPELKSETPWGSFRFTYKLEGNVLKARREVRLTAMRVPAAEVLPYLTFLRELEDATRRKLVFKVP